MFGPLAIGLVLAAGAGSVEQSQSGVALVQTVCIDTAFDRQAFLRLGQQRGWRHVPATRRSGAVGWNEILRTDRATVTLTGVAVDGSVDPALGSICNVMVSEVRHDWRADVEALARRLGMTAQPPASLPGAEVEVWSKFGEATLSATRDARSGSLSIGYSRQIVTYQSNGVTDGS